MIMSLKPLVYLEVKWNLKSRRLVVDEVYGMEKVLYIYFVHMSCIASEIGSRFASRSQPLVEFFTSGIRSEKPIPE